MIQAIGIHAGETTAAEIRKKRWNDSVKIRWADSSSALVSMEVDAYFDLKFSISEDRIAMLASVQRPVFISSMEIPADEIHPSFNRINCWPGMLERPVIELAASGKSNPAAIADVFKALGWNYKLVADIPGFISARMLATIINEAYFTLEAGVSTEDEIDTAMKLGTNYPFGPFEWAKQIGIPNIVRLLQRMSLEDSRYQPAGLLNKLL